MHQRETDGITGAVQDPWSGRERPPVELCFAFADVDAAYKYKVYIYSLALIGIKSHSSFKINEELYLEYDRICGFDVWNIMDVICECN